MLGETVMDPFPFTAIDNQPGLACLCGGKTLRLRLGRSRRRSQTHSSPFTEQHDDGEPRFVGESLKRAGQVEHGISPAGVILYICLIICVSWQRIEEGEFQATKTINLEPKQQG